MDIHIAIFRIRIGRFYASHHHSHRFKNLINKPCKSSTKISQKLRRLATFLALFLSVVSTLEDLQEDKVKHGQHSHAQFNLLTFCNNTHPCFLSLGSLSSIESFLCRLAVHPATTLQGVQAVHLDRGWIPPLLINNNFYARYTYGNRKNRGIKLSHWNAGNAYLENKKID